MAEHKHWKDCTKEEKVKRMKCNAAAMDRDVERMLQEIEDLRAEIEETRDAARKFISVAYAIEAGEIDPEEPPIF